MYTSLKYGGNDLGWRQIVLTFMTPDEITNGGSVGTEEKQSKDRLLEFRIGDMGGTSKETERALLEV